MRRLIAPAALLSLLLAAAPARAQRSALPPWNPDSHVYTVDVPDMPQLRAGVARFQSAVGAQMIVVVVDIADRAGAGQAGDAYSNAAKDYGDDLYEAWVRAGALDRGLDAQKHVLITHALKNRSVGIHWGAAWQALGLHDEAGAQVIDRSEFIPHARAGEYALANLALVERADQDIAEAQRRLAEIKTYYQEDHATIERTIARLSGMTLVPDARKQLETAKATLREAEKMYQSGNVEVARVQLASARDVAGGVEKLDRSQRRNRFLLTRALPAAVGGLVLIFLLIFVLTALRRRRLARTEWQLAREQWQRKLSQGTERLIELEDAHPLFFRPTTDLASTLKGESLTRYRELGEVVDGLMLGIDAARVLEGKADACARGGFLLAARPYAEATRLLSRGDVTLSSETKLERRKLFLPAPRVEKLPVFALFEKLDERYGRAVDMLDALSAEWRGAPKAEQALAGKLDAVAASAQQLEALGVPLSPYRAEMERLAGERVSAEATMPSDFVGARKRCEAAQGAADALAGKLAGAAELAGRIDGALAALGTQEARVAELRKGGLKVREPVFDPDAALADGRGIAREARAEVEAGNLDAARAATDELADRVAGLEARVEATARLRTELGKLLAARRTAMAGLRGRTAPARATLDELTRRFAKSSFAAESDNLQECEPLFQQIEALCAEAEQDGSASAQRYLAGEDRLTRAGNALDAIGELLDAIEQRRAAIDAATAHARADLERARNLRGAIEKLNQDHAFALSAGPVAVMEGGAAAVAELDGELGADKPDWFELEARCGQLAAALADAEAGALRDVEAHAAAEREVDDADAVLARVRGELAASQEDRGPANARLAAAEQELARARELLARAHSDWQLVLAGARSAIALAGSAAELAARDYETARAARMAITAAENAIASADRNYGRGVRANLSDAQGRLAGARSDLERQEYESALARAESASAEAASSQRSAAAEVARRERAEAERLRREFEREQARRRSSFSWGSSSSSSGSSRSSGSIFSSFGSRSSSSSSSSSSSRSWSSGSSSKSYGSGSSGRGY